MVTMVTWLIRHVVPTVTKSYSSGQRMPIKESYKQESSNLIGLPRRDDDSRCNHVKRWCDHAMRAGVTQGGVQRRGRRTGCLSVASQEGT